jgi:hypothetical protein
VNGHGETAEVGDVPEVALLPGVARQAPAIQDGEGTRAEDPDTGPEVPANLDLLTPTMRIVVIEDLCWAMEREAWLARRPRWWRFASRRAWAAEEAPLDAKQERLRDMATML